MIINEHMTRIPRLLPFLTTVERQIHYPSSAGSCHLFRWPTFLL